MHTDHHDSQNDLQALALIIDADKCIWINLRPLPLSFYIDSWMGNSEKNSLALHNGDKVDWEDTQFNKILYKNNRLEATLPIHDKAIYQKWVESQSHNPASTSHYAFNPIKNEFKENGMCGSGGTAKILY